MSRKPSATKAVAWKFSVKKMFLKAQNSQKNTCARVFFGRVAG